MHGSEKMRCPDVLEQNIVLQIWLPLRINVAGLMACNLHIASATAISSSLILISISPRNTMKKVSDSPPILSFTQLNKGPNV
jgi:hypothetical protein